MCKDKDCPSENPVAKEHIAQAWKDTKTSHEKMVKATGIEATDYEGLSPDMKLLWLHQTMIAGAFTEHERKISWLRDQVIGVAQSLNAMLITLALVKGQLDVAAKSQPREAEGPRRDVN